jgi:hypothetical protein
MRFSALSRSSNPQPTQPALPRDEGVYLTDGRRLFRVVRPLHMLDQPDLAILEDCRTLSLEAFMEDELLSMRLRAVTPTSRNVGLV